MHGLIFETSICYWQDQPGISFEFASQSSDTFRDDGPECGGVSVCVCVCVCVAFCLRGFVCSLQRRRRIEHRIASLCSSSATTTTTTADATPAIIALAHLSSFSFSLHHFINAHTHFRQTIQRPRARTSRIHRPVYRFCNSICLHASRLFYGR